MIVSVPGSMLSLANADYCRFCYISLGWNSFGFYMMFWLQVCSIII